MTKNGLVSHCTRNLGQRPTWGCKAP